MLFVSTCKAHNKSEETSQKPAGGYLIAHFKHDVTKGKYNEKTNSKIAQYICFNADITLHVICK